MNHKNYILLSEIEDGPEAKRHGTGNLDYQKLESKVDKNFKQQPGIPLSLEPQNGEQQIIQEKQQLIEDLKVVVERVPEYSTRTRLFKIGWIPDSAPTRLFLIFG